MRCSSRRRSPPTRIARLFPLRRSDEPAARKNRATSHGCGIRPDAVPAAGARRMSAVWATFAFSPSAGCSRVHVPSASSCQAWRLSASSVSKIGVQLGLRPLRLDRHDDLDAVVEVARHQVGAADQVVARRRRRGRRRGGCARGSARARSAPVIRSSTGPEHADAPRDDVDASRRPSAAASSSSMMPGSVSALTLSLISARLPSAAAIGDLADQRDQPRHGARPERRAACGTAPDGRSPSGS